MMTKLVTIIFSRFANTKHLDPQCVVDNDSISFRKRMKVRGLSSPIEGDGITNTNDTSFDVLYARDMNWSKNIMTTKDALKDTDRFKTSVLKTVRECKRQLQQMNKQLEEEEKAHRYERIFQQDNNLRKVYDWVHQNQKMFCHNNLGPIVCEIATKTNKHIAAYLEQHVENAVLKSFVVNSREDCNLLYWEVQEKCGLGITIQIVPHGKLQGIKRKYSEGRTEVLKREHGVLGYLDESFEAPDAVL